MPYVAAKIAIDSNKPSLDAALEGLVRMNQQQIRVAAREGRPVPSVYRAGVHWQRDHGETWDTIQIVRQRGYGDCEDLASWRAAELRERGIPAHAVVRRSNTPGVAWHAVVQWPNGQIEDPSAKLGMYNPKYRAIVGDETAGDDDGNVVGAQFVLAIRPALVQLARTLRAAGVL